MGKPAARHPVQRFAGCRYLFNAALGTAGLHPLSADQQVVPNLCLLRVDHSVVFAVSQLHVSAPERGRIALIPTFGVYPLGGFYTVG